MVCILWLGVSNAPALEALPEAANWISNPSFETGSGACPVDWFFANQHELTVGSWTNTSAFSGSNGVRVTGQSGLAFGRWMTPYRMFLEPGKNYRFSYRYRGVGSTVYLLGHPAALGSNGLFQVNLSNNFKRVLGSGSTSNWTYVETNYIAPGSGLWAQMCLVMETGNLLSEYDEIDMSRPGIVVLDPSGPLVTSVGKTNRVVVYVDELRTNTPATVTWTITSDNFALRGVEHDPTNMTWALLVESVASGVADVTLRAAPSVGSAITNRLLRFARVRPGADSTFAFAALADTQFYRPGPNERNDRFGQIAGSLNALDPAFAVALGDQMDDTRGMWDEDKKLVSDAVRQQLGRLNVPVFSLPGRHEIGKFYEGAQTRWFHEKYLQQPSCFAVEVDGTLIAGLDLTAVGDSERENGGAFLRAGQAAWFQSVLGAYTGRLSIVAGHVPVYGEFEDGADRDQLLGLLYTNRVRAVLSGYRHETVDQWIRNPHADGQTSAPWPTNVVVLADAAAGSLKLADASNTVFLSTVTACADLQGAATFHGYRYLLVRNQQIVWQDVLPLSLSITRSSSVPHTVTFRITNGNDKAVNGLPLRAELPYGLVTATLNGAPLAVDVTALPDGRKETWVQVDIATGTDAEIVLRSENPVLTNGVFSCGFETTDPPAYQNGQQLHRAGSTPYRWNVHGSDIAVVTNDPVAVHAGGQGLSAARSSTTGSRLWWTLGTNAFAPVTSGIVKVSFSVKASNWATSANTLLDCWIQTDAMDAPAADSQKSGRSAWITLLGNGRLQAYTNNSTAQNVRTNVDVMAWNTLRLDLAVTSRTYNVFLNGEQVATNFTFYGNNTSTSVNSVQFKEYNNGLSNGAVYLDSVVVEQIVPDPAADVDGDGMPDGWESDKFGTTTNGAVFDNDDDGWNNFQEYVADTHPADSNSYWGPLSFSGFSNLMLTGTSTARLYLLSGTTNLAERPQVWLPVGGLATGTGGSLIIPVTNDAPQRIYRGAVQLP